MSSCCGGNCGCGSDCKCGSGCGGDKMCPDMGISSSSETRVMGVAAPEGTEKMEGAGMGVAGVDNGCKCGANCTCDPCNCEKTGRGGMSVAGAENGCKCGSNCACDPCTCNK